jgi:hypothetical protein
LVVRDVLAVAVPPVAAHLARVLHRVEQGLLTLVVAGVGLHKVNNRKFVFDVAARIAHFEIEPLRISRGVVVVLEYQVVRVSVQLDSAPQIAALKAGLEDQRVVVRRLLHVVGLQGCVALVDFSLKLSALVFLLLRLTIQRL